MPVLDNSLQTKVFFDRLDHEKEKPPVGTEGDSKQKSNLVVSKYDRNVNTPILTESPNLCKKIGDSMSDDGFVKLPRSLLKSETWRSLNIRQQKLFLYILEKAQINPFVFKYNGKDIHLEPGDFCKSYRELAEDFNQTVKFKDEKITPSFVQRAVSAFLRSGIADTRTDTDVLVIRIIYPGIYDHLKPQPDTVPDTSAIHPRYTNQEREEREERKKNHPPTPSFQKNGDGRLNDDRLNDDLFSKEEEKEKIHVHSGKYNNGKAFSVYLTQKELDDCIKSRGSIERIRDVIDQVANWPGREYEIKDWLKTILKWKFKNVVGDRTAENEKTGKNIEELYGDCVGWSARVYRDPMKDVRGILFESSASVGNPTPIFVPFSEASFKEKCSEVIKSKKMKRKGGV